MRHLLAGLIVAGTIVAFPDSVSAAEPAAVEQYLVREVGHELRTLPYYGVFDNLYYEVKGDDVTLRGSVTKPTVKESAENAVKRIEGVDDIHNEIEVLPVSNSDDRIRLDAFLAVYGHPALNRYTLSANLPIRIIVKNGEVTLVGVVGQELDRDLAAAEVSSIAGVRKVTNQLQASRD